MIWCCVICYVFVALTLKSLLSHINFAHSRSPDFRLVCGIDGCTKEYRVYNSFWYHVRRTHSQYLDGVSRTRSLRRERSVHETSVTGRIMERHWKTLCIYHPLFLFLWNILVILTLSILVKRCFLA